MHSVTREARDIFEDVAFLPEHGMPRDTVDAIVSARRTARWAKNLEDFGALIDELHRTDIDRAAEMTSALVSEIDAKDPSIREWAWDRLQQSLSRDTWRRLSRARTSYRRSRVEMRRRVRDAPPSAPECEPWRSSITHRRTPEGEWVPKPQPHNLALMLAHHPSWRGRIRHDLLMGSAVLVGDAPAIPGLETPQPGAISDHMIAHVRAWASISAKMDMSSPEAACAIEEASHLHRFHPVRDYLRSLSWDGVPRLGSWLADHVGASPDDATSAMGRIWLLSAAARALRSGCQVDHMLVLEGPQAAGKTSVFRILGGDWYRGSVGDLSSSDAAQSTRGAWIIEIGELDAFRGRESTRIKDFLTQTHDYYRPPYGRTFVHQPRSCVFAGTTNEATYLRDSTGNRRFFTVSCGSIDLEGLAAARDQLWAEACHRVDAGDQWWPSRDELRAFQPIADDRLEVDGWLDAIREYMQRELLIRDHLTVSDIAHGAIGLELARLDRPAQTRIGAIAAQIPGVERVRIRVDGCRTYVYRSV